MNKEIIIRYSELTLKGKNRKEFSNFLVFNIQKKLDEKNLKYRLEKGYDKLLVLPEGDIKDFLLILKKVSGISWFAEVIKVEATRDNIKKALDEMLEDVNIIKTFRVSAKDSKKDAFESTYDLTNFVAGYILENYKLKVSLNKFDLEVSVKITDTNEALIYIHKHEGIVGLPAGSAGKALTLLSGGIDSPVAAYKVITRGMNTSFITFLNNETGNHEVLNKIKALAKKVNEYNGINGKLYLVNFTRIQNILFKLPGIDYRIILLRRMYLKFADLIAYRYKYKAFVTGDAIGQVASQTIESMTIVDEATNRLVIRPLITSSKIEIIKEAVNIGTLDISNLPGDDMCSLFAPSKPIIHPKFSFIKEQEKMIEDMENILFKVLKEDMRIIKLGDKE